MTQSIHMGRTYRHIKTGKLYAVIRIGRMEGTFESVVIYESDEYGNVWVRPYQEFIEKFVLVGGSK